MSDWIAIGLSALLVLITAVYAGLTHRLARASDRSAAASEAAAISAAQAAEHSRVALETQKATLAVQRSTQPMGFVLGAAGPFESGFGFSLRTDGGSYLVRAVRLQNLTLKPAYRDDPGVTYGQDTPLEPTEGSLPRQLDPPDHLLFEVPAFESMAKGAYRDEEVVVAWWNVIVECSFSEDDPVRTRVRVWSDLELGAQFDPSTRRGNWSTPKLRWN